ncbi:cation:proton antiporter [Gammaproteobacteria bacterium]|nr:cation:proton antiporter [Gammaproteobacteria bacterium]
MQDSIVSSIFLIFTGAAVVATLALWARQTVVIAYVVLGALVGPHVLGWISDADLIEKIAEFGIIFLLFLLGLSLPPRKLVSLFRETLVVTMISCAVFAGVGYGIARLFGVPAAEAWIVGAAVAFSSTIIGLKLLPTTVLHHRRTGELMISILLLQDLLAIGVLIAIHSGGDPTLFEIARPFFALPIVAAVAWFGEKFVVRPLLMRFDRIQEYTFLMTLGWCLGIAMLAHVAGLSYETGAFVAGVVLANNPISQVLAEQLKPVRDFFLVMFFFAIGAGFDFAAAGTAMIGGTLLAAVMLLLKPVVLRLLLMRHAETSRRGWEVGTRLGQCSEFSLLIVALALANGRISDSTAYMVQWATVLTLMASAFWIVRNYQSPMAIRDDLRAD